MATTVFITGANRGIGLELAKGYAARGARVLAAGRQMSPELEAVADGFFEVDVTDDDGVASLEARVDEGIDLLINNAGLLRRTPLGTPLDLASMRAQFEVNALGPLKVTAALRPHLREGGKVVVITSRMGSIADNTSGSHYGYRMSKAAVNMAGMSLAHDLSDQGIAVALLHPGAVRTGMTGGHGNWDADEAAPALMERIDELSMATSGAFVHANGEALPW